MSSFCVLERDTQLLNLLGTPGVKNAAIGMRREFSLKLALLLARSPAEKLLIWLDFLLKSIVYHPIT